MNTPTSKSISAWTAHDLIDKRLTVYAQRSLLRLLRGNPIQQKVAADLITAVKSGVIEGIYVVNQAKPALRAREIDTYWWLLIPKGTDGVCITTPAHRPPLLALSVAATRNNNRVDRALMIAWMSLTCSTIHNNMLSYDWPLLEQAANGARINSFIDSASTPSLAGVHNPNQRQEIRAKLGMMALLLYYMYQPGLKNIFGPKPRTPQNHEKAWLRIHALALLTNYTHSMDMNYWKGKQEKAVIGEINDGDYRFAELLAASYRPVIGQNNRGKLRKNGQKLYTDYLSGGAGTTCGYLCHWLLWRLGCLDYYAKNKNLLNRSTPISRHIVGRNIGNLQLKMHQFKLWENPKNLKQAANALKPGDIILIATAKAVGGSRHDHVFVYLGQKVTSKGVYWITAETGQELNLKKSAPNIPRSGAIQGGRIKMRKVINRMSKYIRLEDGYPNAPRYVLGVLPLDKLTYQSMPDVDEYYRKQLHEPGVFHQVSPRNAYLNLSKVYDALVNGPIYNHNSSRKITDPKLMLSPGDFNQLLQDAFTP